LPQASKIIIPELEKIGLKITTDGIPLKYDEKCLLKAKLT